MVSRDAPATGKSSKKHLRFPATGPIGLEGDKGQMEYRRIRISQM
jgi:hypothetical protein